MGRPQAFAQPPRDVQSCVPGVRGVFGKRGCDLCCAFVSHLYVHVRHLFQSLQLLVSLTSICEKA